MFVRGVMARNAITPELEYYQIRGGRITGFNGHLALSAPIDLDIEACPKAAPFFKALEKIDGAKSVSLYLTKAGKLAVKGDNFAAYIPCAETFPYDSVPTGEKHLAPETLLDDLSRALPFVSEDASRLWSQGVLMHNGTAMATNNVVLVQIWSGHTLPTLNLPKYLVSEILRVKKAPEFLVADENSLSCIYADGSWMRSSVLSGGWPFETLEKVMSNPGSPAPISPAVGVALDQLAPFLDGKSAPVYFRPDGLATSPHEEDGAIVAGELPAGPIFTASQLKLVIEAADAIDWSAYPAPVPFTGDRMRGVILGRRA